MIVKKLQRASRVPEFQVSSWFETEEVSGAGSWLMREELKAESPAVVYYRII
jgi:hypothetical protein